MKLNWNFQRGEGVLRRIPSMQEVHHVWIFSGTTQFSLHRVYHNCFSPGWTRLSRLKIHFHTENKTGLQRLPCFSIRTRHRTFMNLTGKIIQSRNHCSNCNHYKRLSKRKLIKSKQSWLSSMLTERTPTSFTVIRCQNS